MANNIFLAPSPVVPGTLLITAISTTNPMVVSITDSIYNTYIVGQLAHLSVPASYGMIEANQLTGLITAINGADFTLAINATGFSPFVPPDPNSLPPPSQFATLAPGGSRNIYNSIVEPFHSLSNTGN